MDKKKIMWIVGIAIALIALIIGIICLVINKNNKDKEDPFDTNIVTTITIDINPSIEINLNKDNKIISVVGLNEDSEAVLKDKNFKGNDLETAMDTLVDSLQELGYLKEDNNMILINVYSTEEVELNVEDAVNKVLSSNEIKCEVVLQNIEVTEELMELAEKYNMTPSKAYYISEQIKDKDLKFEDFEETSIGDIKTKVNEYVEEQEKAKQETEKKQSQSNTSQESRKGSLWQCEHVTVNFSNTQATDAAIAAAGANDLAKREAQTTLDLYNGECAWETIFYYNKMKYYYYYSISSGSQLNSKSEPYVATSYDDVSQLTKEYMSQRYGVSMDDVFVQGSGSSGYDDPNNEITAKIGETYYTVIMSKKTGQVISCTEGSKYH